MNSQQDLGFSRSLQSIQSQCPGSVNGKLRTTIQGEVVENYFSTMYTAEMTFERYTGSVMLATAAKREQCEYKEVMEKISQKSMEKYRELVYGCEDFLEYFTRATPINELNQLNIGSRPAKRKNLQGVEHLRAIPWIFSFTQNRLHLPVWLGVADGLKSIEMETLRKMYKDWPFFKTVIDLIQNVLSKVSVDMSILYEKELVPEKFVFS